jgi:DNA-3-methyladenine glycosylase II
VVIRSFSPYLHGIHAMSSRRSSRLSANATALEEDADIANGTALSQPVKETKKRKAPAKENAVINGNNAGPSTPKKKRATKKLPPETPTPKAVGLMSSPYNDPGIAPPAVNRLAVPNGTNAPLVSPETHRLISSKPVDQVSPSKKSNITTTTKNLLDDAVAHLIKIEPKLKQIVEKHPCRVFSEEGLADEIDPFNSLVSGIISQQVSWSLNSILVLASQVSNIYSLIKSF